MDYFNKILTNFSKRFKKVSSIEYIFVVAILAMIVTKINHQQGKKLNNIQNAFSYSGTPYSAIEKKAYKPEYSGSYIIVLTKLDFPRKGEITVKIKINDLLTINEEIPITDQCIEILKKHQQKKQLSAYIDKVNGEYLFQHLLIDGGSFNHFCNKHLKSRTRNDQIQNLKSGD